MSRRIMFVIRGKLGDSLLAFMVLRAYAMTFPDHEICLLTRRAYVSLFEEEMPGQVIGFNSRIEMILRLLWLRLQRRRFDVLAILWGFGSPIGWVGRWVMATQKIYLNGRMAKIFPAYPESQEVQTLVDPAWKVVQVFAPEVKKPEFLYLEGLAHLHRQRKIDGLLGVIPVADEPRKCLNLQSLLALLNGLQKSQKQRSIWVLLNARDAGAHALLDAVLPAGCEIKRFSNISELLELLVPLAEWVGVDTGLYHLAVAMGIPATLYFGPTQPEKIVLPAQPAVTPVRLGVLGNQHCEVKTCTKPYCLYQALDNHFETAQIVPHGELPTGCLLTNLTPAQWLTNRENLSRGA